MDHLPKFFRVAHWRPRYQKATLKDLDKTDQYQHHQNENHVYNSWNVLYSSCYLITNHVACHDSFVPANIDKSFMALFEFFPHKWPVTRKCFHLMTSSCGKFCFTECNFSMPKRSDSKAAYYLFKDISKPHCFTPITPEYPMSSFT